MNSKRVALAPPRQAAGLKAAAQGRWHSRYFADQHRACRQAIGRVRTALLAPLAWLMTAPSWAAGGLPTVTPPTTGAGGVSCGEGELTCYISGYVGKGLVFLAVILGAAFLLYYGIGIFTRWKSYSDGREEMGHVISFALIGAVLAGVVVLLAWQATQYLGVSPTTP